jgi:phage I-like protein
MGGVSDKIVTVAAAATEVPVDGATPLRHIKILPIGEIRLRDGRGPYRIRDRAHAEQVVAATRQWLGTLDFNFDYNHGEVAAAKQNGATSEASGWTKPADLTVEDDGIYADVDWTVDASAAIAAKKYRYLSPLFVARPPADGGDVIHLKNAALVNIGAIDLPAVAAGLSEENDQMDLAALLALLGLKPDASPEVIAAAVTEMKTKATAAPSTSSIAIAAGLADSATVEEIAAAVTTIKAAGAPDPTKFVPIEQLQSVTTQLNVLATDRAEREVAAAIECGKLAPAAKPWGLEYFQKDEAGFKKWLGVAPVVVAAGAVVDEVKPGAKRTSLTADEVAACDMTGTSQDDYLKMLNGETV